MYYHVTIKSYCLNQHDIIIVQLVSYVFIGITQSLILQSKQQNQKQSDLTSTDQMRQPEGHKGLGSTIEGMRKKYYFIRGQAMILYRSVTHIVTETGIYWWYYTQRQYMIVIFKLIQRQYRIVIFKLIW